MGKRIFCDGMWPLMMSNMTAFYRRERWLRRMVPDPSETPTGRLLLSLLAEDRLPTKLVKIRR
jgi:hypothetical protein